jgi:hypothetical protein
MNDLVTLKVASRLWPEQDARGFNYFDFLHACGSPSHALFYSGLFWPQFVEVDGMVFLEGTIEDESDLKRVRDALERYANDREKTEKSFNTIEMPSLFGGRGHEATAEEERFLAAQLCAMWAARLRELFPTRTFVVEVVPPDNDDEIAVRFYQPAAVASLT